MVWHHPDPRAVDRIVYAFGERLPVAEQYERDGSLRACHHNRIGNNRNRNRHRGELRHNIVFVTGPDGKNTDARRHRMREYLGGRGVVRTETLSGKIRLRRENRRGAPCERRRIRLRPVPAEYPAVVVVVRYRPDADQFSVCVPQRHGLRDEIRVVRINQQRLIVRDFRIGPDRIERRRSREHTQNLRAAAVVGLAKKSDALRTTWNRYQPRRSSGGRTDVERIG